MTLCPSDTLQDWLRKRNARLSSSEAERSGSRSGVLFEDDARVASSRAQASPASPPPAARPSAATAESPPAPRDDRDNDNGDGDGDDANTGPLPPALLPDEIESGDGDGGGDRDGNPHGGRRGKAGHGTPVTSPRTDPVTSASSGVSDETSESSSSSSSSGGGGGSDGSGSGSGGGEGTLCPPPTRETSRKCEHGGSATMQEAFETTAGETKKGPAAGVGSPARSVSSEAGSCDGRGVGGVGSRVDLHEALRLFRQLAEGVSHIHSKGIIHRDIKVREPTAEWMSGSTDTVDRAVCSATEEMSGRFFRDG